MSELPVSRPHKDEIEALVYMMCNLTSMLSYEETLKKRLKTIPNGWRDYKCAISLMRKMTDNILRTFTPEKVKTVKAMMPNIRYNVKYHQQVGRKEDCVSAIYTSDLDLLCSVAMEYCCKLCDGQCDRCDVGKVLDSMLTLDREDGESYAFMKTELAGFKRVGTRRDV